MSRFAGFALARGLADAAGTVRGALDEQERRQQAAAFMLAQQQRQQAQDAENTRRWEAEFALRQQIASQPRGTTSQAAPEFKTLDVDGVPTVTMIGADGTKQVIGKAYVQPKAERPPASRLVMDKTGTYVPVDPLTGRNAMTGETVQSPETAKTGTPTESERRAAGLLSLIEDADAKLNAVLQSGAPTTGEQLMGRVPIVGRVVASDRARQMRQATEQMVANALYLLSGASSTDPEVRRQIDILTPQPFDDPATAAQKAQGRRTLVEAARKIAGRAVPQTPTAAAPTPAGSLEAAYQATRRRTP